MYDVLATTRINRVIDELVDIRQYSTNFRYLNRLKKVNALDEEIFARYRGRIYAADIITLDGKAVIRSLPAVRLTQTEVPVFKHGVGITRENLRLLRRIESNLASTADIGIFANFVASEIQNLIMGVYTRENAVACGMFVDGFSYNRLGVIMDGVTWGMPADLKVTLAGADRINQPATSKIVSIILTYLTNARTKYGIRFDRLTLSTTAFNYLTNTAEFIARASSLYLGIGTIALPQGNTEALIPLMARVFNVASIEIDDDQFWTEGTDGIEGTSRYLPENALSFDCAMFDGTGQAHDFANAELEETMPGMVPDIIGGFEGTETTGYGPVGYATAASSDANPPGINLWGVSSGFPRKHKEASSGVIFAY